MYQIHTYPPLSEWPRLAVCVTTDDNGRRDYWSDIQCYWSAVSASWVNGLAALRGKVEKLDLKGIKNDGINSKVTREQQAARDIDDETGAIALLESIKNLSFDGVPNAKQRAIECGYIGADNSTKRTHYHVEIALDIWVDVYDVLLAWGVTNPAYQHLIKKALKPGNRGHKDLMTDAQDIVDSAIRGKQLIEKSGGL